MQTKLAWWNLQGQLQAIGLTVPKSFAMHEWVEPNDHNIDDEEDATEQVMGTGEMHVDTEAGAGGEQPGKEDNGHTTIDKQDTTVSSSVLGSPEVRMIADEPLPSDFETDFRRLWRSNGDHISTQYAGSAALRKDTHTNEAFADFDSGLRFGKQFAINMQYNARRYMMNTVGDPIKNDILAVILGYPKGEVESSSALWVADQMRARRDEYTQRVRTQAAICTYNVGLATPSKQMVKGLRSLLRPHGVADETVSSQQDDSTAGGVKGGPAFVLVGLQRVARTTSVAAEVISRWSELITAEVEAVYSDYFTGADSVEEAAMHRVSANPAVAEDGGDAVRSRDEDTSGNTPNKGGRAYTLLVSKAAGGSLLLVFVRRDLATAANPDVAVQNARVAWYSSGMLSGSRGTLAFRCECSGSSLCFMSSHFEGKSGEISDTLKCGASPYF